MRILPEKFAELRAEYDWLEWKREEHKKSISGDGEFRYWDSGEQKSDRKRRSEIKKILKKLNPGDEI